VSRIVVFVLAGCLFALAPDGRTAPVPRHLMKDSPVRYHPVTSGAKWEYERDGKTVTLVASKVETRGAARVVTVEIQGQDRRGPCWVVEVSEVGLAQTELGGLEMNPPLMWLQAPIKVGNSWGITTRYLKGTKTIGAVEKVTVPAGTFEAVRVDSDYTLQGNKEKGSTWFAPGVGLLRMTDSNGDDVWLLKSFTPGK
jgi:hypothetical protein